MCCDVAQYRVVFCCEMIVAWWQGARIRSLFFLLSWADPSMLVRARLSFPSFFFPCLYQIFYFMGDVTGAPCYCSSWYIYCPYVAPFLYQIFYFCERCHSCTILCSFLILSWFIHHSCAAPYVAPTQYSCIIFVHRLDVTLDHLALMRRTQSPFMYLPCGLEHPWFFFLLDIYQVPDLLARVLPTIRTSTRADVHIMPNTFSLPRIFPIPWLR